MEAPEEPARRIRWEDRGRTPPEGRLILTYQLTNDGPAYRPALWDGSTFRSPNGRKELTGLQYTHWLELPAPGSGAPGEAVVDFDLGDGVIVREVCCYADGQFYFRVKSGELGAKIDMPAVRWMWLPPIEENR